MRTLESIKELVNHIKFKDWTFRVEDKNGCPFLQVIFMDKCSVSGKEEPQHCRKWTLSYHMVDCEVIRTAFKAVQTAMEHEVQEQFTYKGARIFNPHLNLDSLVDVALNKKNIQIRK